jgi:hypothetical protein
VSLIKLNPWIRRMRLNLVMTSIKSLIKMRSRRINL